MLNLAEVTVAVDVLVNVSVEIRVELGRRWKERQTDSDQFPTQRRALPIHHIIVAFVQQRTSTTGYRSNQ